MNFTDFIKDLRTAAASVALGAAMFAAPDVAMAQSPEVTIEQVQPGRGGSRTGYYQDTTGTGNDTGEYVPVQLATGGTQFAIGSANLSAISQSGNSNFASVNINGVGNLTLQDQRGAFNTSEVDVVGSANRVLVNQEGVGLQSDINLNAANGQTVVHLQRGRATSRTATPIDIGNAGPSVTVVLDTPRGRRVVTK
ncbi:MAG: hypothetical protein RIA08_17565 [Roseovarius sp.]|uniref:hypothetical protein n=1 Tax=Roseovarius sp. TaxID=1486281 RepID=UPI0032EBEA28